MPLAAEPVLAYRNSPPGWNLNPVRSAVTGGVKGEFGTGASAPVPESTENPDMLFKERGKWVGRTCFPCK
jgi:hypothetical protein